jgi:hypothetical protein
MGRVDKLDWQCDLFQPSQTLASMVKAHLHWRRFVIESDGKTAKAGFRLSWQCDKP